jgi:hypothetical protein
MGPVDWKAHLWIGGLKCYDTRVGWVDELGVLRCDEPRADVGLREPTPWSWAI